MFDGFLAAMKAMILLAINCGPARVNGQKIKLTYGRENRQAAEKNSCSFCGRPLVAAN